MKTIHNINRWSFIITLLLYLTIIGGLLAQIVLGGIQIILAVIIISKWKKYTSTIKKHLWSYGIITIIYGVSWLLDITKIFETNSMVMDPHIIYLCVVPMSIALYFVYITYKIENSSNELQPNYL